MMTSIRWRFGSRTIPRSSRCVDGLSLRKGMPLSWTAMMISSQEAPQGIWATPDPFSSRKRTSTSTETSRCKCSPEQTATGRSSWSCLPTRSLNPEEPTASLTETQTARSARMPSAASPAPRVCLIARHRGMMCVGTHAGRMASGRRESTPECTGTIRLSRRWGSGWDCRPGPHRMLGCLRSVHDGNIVNLKKYED